jgi:large subunit ribosomal protein L22
MRQVVDLVRGKSVDEALSMLSFVPKSAAVPVRKTLQSAAANALAAEGTTKLKSEDLRIRKIFVDGGPTMKRIRPMGMGRAYRIRKPLCHLTVILEGASRVAAPVKTAVGKTGASAEAKSAAKSGAQTAAKKPATKTAARKIGVKTKAAPRKRTTKTKKGA